jgi:GAF domain-containing protein
MTTKILETIYQLGRELTLLHEEAAIVRRVLEAVTQTLNFEMAGYGWVNEATDQLEFRYRIRAEIFEAIDWCLPLSGPEAKGISVVVVRTGQALNIPDVAQDPRYLAYLVSWFGRSELCVPLKINQRVVGVLNVESQAINAFTPADQQLLQTLADQAAVALENANLYRRAQQELAERERVEAELQRAANQRLRLLEFSQALLIDLSLDQRVELTRVVLESEIPHDIFAPYWLDEAAELLRPMETRSHRWFGMSFSHWSIQVGEGILGDIARKKEAEYVNDAHLDSRAIYPPGWREQIASEHLMGLPLWGPEKMMGMIALGRVTLPPFTPEEFELAQLFINQAALALHNAYHYRETQWRLQEQMALRRAGALMSSTLDLKTVLHYITEQLCEAVEATSVFISSYDPDAATATIIAEYISPQACPQEQVSVLNVTYDLTQVFPEDIELLQTGQPKVRQVDDPLLSLQQRQHLAQYGCRTALDIPMQIGGRSIAYASVWESRRRREFTAEEIALCQAIAQQGAINLQNAQLHQAERVRFHEAEALRRAALALTSTIDLNQLLERILIELKHVVPYDTASVQLLKGDYLEVIGGHGFDHPASVVGTKIQAQDKAIPNTHVMSSLEPIIIEDIKASPIPFDQELPGTNPIRAWLGVPLVINNRSIGMITLDKHQPNFYTPAHAQTAAAYAAQAAIALENARLYKDLQDQMQALRATQLQLMHSERMAALGRLIASIAHEINNPFQAIQGFFHLLAEELDGQRRPEKINHYLDIAGSEIDRIATIINRMRTFYRPTNQAQLQPDSTGDFFNLDPTQLQAVDLHAILESVLQLTRKKLQQNNIHVEQLWAQNLPLLQANPDFLKQVFLNLTLNAIDAMAERGGVLRIQTNLDQAPPGSDPAYPVIRLKFSDNGMGMSPEMASHLFEPLFSTKEQGSGLGLFTSYQIIQAHRGQITASSQVGEGTTFTILLPLR